MYVGKSLISGIQQHTVRFLLRGHGSSWILAGTLAVAGLGAATLNRPASAPAQPDHSIVAPSTLPSAYNCFNDPDGDGTIKCPSSVPISSLPAAWGNCVADLYGDELTVCDGTKG